MIDPAGIGFWGFFYSLVALSVAVIVFIGAVDRQRRLGAGMLALTWAASWVARVITGEMTPFAAYAVIDVCAVYGFFIIAEARRAGWAVLQCLIHTAMGVLHVAASVFGASEMTYIIILNGLFLAAVFVIHLAAYGRFIHVERPLDRFVHRSFSGFSFSGSVRPGARPTA